MAHLKNWPIIIILFGAMIGNAQGFDDFQWKNRLLFLVANNLGNQALQQQLETFKKVGPNLRERDLIIFLMDREQVYDMHGSTTELSPRYTYDRLGLSSDFTGLVLVGKDGGVKYKTNFPVAPIEIFDRIDAMPMRRAEMRNK